MATRVQFHLVIVRNRVLKKEKKKIKYSKTETEKKSAISANLTKIEYWLYSVLKTKRKKKEQYTLKR